MILLDYFDLYRAQALALLVAAIAILVLGLAFGGDVLGRGKAVPLQCMLLDVSASTRTAQPQYSGLARSILAEQSARDGKVCYIVVKGDPAAESDIVTRSVAADDPGNSSDAPVEREAKQVQVASEIDSLLRDPPQTIGGSAIVEALDIVARQVHPGDSIHVFSDGLQDSQNFVLRSLNSVGYAPTAISTALDGLDAKGFLPRLTGVTVIFETPGFRPGVQRSIVPDPDAERFWKAWGARVDAATLQWGPAQ